MDAEAHRRLLATPRDSLAKLNYSGRWEIERVERSTEWVAVLRQTRHDYICIIGAHDLAQLRYKMDQAEHDEHADHDTSDESPPQGSHA